MKTPVHAHILSNNLVELFFNEEGSRFALHGDVKSILEKENLEIVSVWQRNPDGGLEICWKDRFYQWVMPPAKFEDALKRLVEYQTTINADRKLRHNTCLQIISYGGHAPNIMPVVLDDLMLKKFCMFLDGSWMVSPHIPTSVVDIICSLKEFSLLPEEPSHIEAVHRLTKGNLNDIRSVFKGAGLTFNLAMRLSAVSGMTADWWMNKDFEYQYALFENNLELQIEVHSLTRK